MELEDFQMDVKDLEMIFEAGAAGQIMPKLKLPPAAIAGGKPLTCCRFLSYRQSKLILTKSLK